MGNCCLVACLSVVRGDPKFVCRDDMSEKASKPSKEGGRRVAGITDLHGRGGRSRVVGSWEGVTRVKILLTKKEAALLLSNFKFEEGLLKCKISQLQKIGIFPSSPDHCENSRKPALESVSEEY